MARTPSNLTVIPHVCATGIITGERHGVGAKTEGHVTNLAQHARDVVHRAAASQNSSRVMCHSWGSLHPHPHPAMLTLVIVRYTNFLMLYPGVPLRFCRECRGCL